MCVGDCSVQCVLFFGGLFVWLFWGLSLGSVGFGFSGLGFGVCFFCLFALYSNRTCATATAVAVTAAAVEVSIVAA